MRTCTAVLACLVMPLILSAGDEAAVKKELKAMAGQWKAIACSEGGKELDKVPNITLVLKADGTATVKMEDEKFEVRLTVNPAKKPKTMDISHESGDQKGKMQYAIYKLEGNKLTVLGSEPGAAENARPKGFDDADAKARQFVFERVKEKK